MIGGGDALWAGKVQILWIDNRQELTGAVPNQQKPRTKTKHYAYHKQGAARRRFEPPHTMVVQPVQCQVSITK
jgi:hypothetical protein